MTSIESLINNTVVVVNNIEYKIGLDGVTDCLGEDVSYSFCVCFVVKNVSRASYYNVQVVRKEPNGSALDGYLLVN